MNGAQLSPVAAEQRLIAEATDTPRLVLISNPSPEAGPRRRPRRTRVGHTRPGLPTDPTNPWCLTVSLWAQALGENLNTSGTYQRGKLSATEQANYLKRVGWLAGDHADQTPWSLTAHELATWLDAQHSWSLGTRRQVIVAVRNFYAWATRAGLCAKSPLAGVSVTPPKPAGPTKQALPPAWTVPLAEWLTWLRGAARSESTIRTRAEHIENLAQLHADPWDVTETDLMRWLSRADLAPATKRARRSSARAFYSWAARVGNVATDPARDLDPITQPRPLPRPTPTQVIRDAVTVADDRVQLALTIAAYAGLRRAEIAALHTRDLGETSIRVTGKGGRERLVPIHPELRGILDAELTRRRLGSDVGTGWGHVIPPADGWLFPGLDPTKHLTPRWLGTLISRTLGPGWTAHTLRHRFASQAYATQRDLRAVQELLGHSKPETTARYAAVPDGAMNAAVLGVTL